jgi:hypothetical protein
MYPPVGIRRTVHTIGLRWTNEHVGLKLDWGLVLISHRHEQTRERNRNNC